MTWFATVVPFVIDSYREGYILGPSILVFLHTMPLIVFSFAAGSAISRWRRKL